MALPFTHPRPLPSEQPALSSAVQNTITKAQRSIERLNQLIISFENPKVLIRPVMRKEAHSTSSIEGVNTPYEKLVSNSIQDFENQEFLEVRNFMDTAEFAIDWVMIDKKLSLPFFERLHKELFSGIKRWGESIGKFRQVEVKIVNSDGYEFYPMKHGEEINESLKGLLTWFNKTKDWDPIVAISCFHYYFEAIHPFEDGNGRIGRLLAILQLREKNLLDFPILDISTWLKNKTHLYQLGFQKVTLDNEWETHIGIMAAAFRGAADELIIEIKRLDELHKAERAKVKQAFRSHSRATDVLDFALEAPEFTVPQLSEELGISFKSANALVAKLVDIGSLVSIGDSRYDRRFKNHALYEYAKNGF